MLASTLRSVRLASQRTARRYASTGGSSPHPIKDSGKELAGTVQDNSKLLVFGGLGAIALCGGWWIMADTADPLQPPITQKASSDQPQLQLKKRD
ncbi:hypothetical protein JCM11641_005607 [Rhodosporidiobolus odoratus]